MTDQIAIGVDIGGSHITSAAVNLKTFEILGNTTFSARIDNKASKELIFKDWSKAINKTIESASMQTKAEIGFAIPGPFNYKTGVALFEGENDKYENLRNVSVTKEFPKYLNSENVSLRYLNDATAFGVGVSTQGKAKTCKKVIVVTLGTGFGSAFISNGVPQVNSDDVPQDGCLWDKPYKSGISDDYFSTRWCIERYFELTSQRVKGVKEIAEANTEDSRKVFDEFGSNMAEFMIPFIKDFKAEILVMGGNVSKASDLFLPVLKKELEKAGAPLEFEVSTLLEDAAIIGSAKLFVNDFWNVVKNELPEI
ncbi:ROK family protein [Maribacter polysaccharolyticus]|uniref:ROK family protein n=1 Tax=Maribacter polysaccharolyticus TaxID=3020831 RepID=UPI00237F303D|nr:ROK family protein [Maribacter polysaccharolyticus]MDE3743178.1 ROK family protein [Maribacter polysaccharolyticus]